MLLGDVLRLIQRATMSCRDGGRGEGGTDGGREGRR